MHVSSCCIVNPQIRNVVNFTDLFDQKLAENGPPGMFTFTHDGEIHFDLFRTRDWLRRFPVLKDTIKWNHCVCIDIATQWPMYVLFTSDEMVRSDSSTITRRFDTLVEATTFLEDLKIVLFKKADP